MPISAGGTSSSSGSTVLFDSTLGANSGAGIDTGAAGIAQTANVIDVYIYARTDEAVVNSGINVTLNNDTGAVYDRIFVQGANATASANNALAQTAFGLGCAGASQAASVFSLYQFVFFNYRGTVGNKSGLLFANNVGQAAANTFTVSYGIVYRSTSAISRLKVIQSGGSNLLAGSRVTILGR